MLCENSALLYVFGKSPILLFLKKITIFCKYCTNFHKINQTKVLKEEKQMKGNNRNKKVSAFFSKNKITSVIC